MFLSRAYATRLRSKGYRTVFLRGGFGK
jgi:hypothetical protein